MSGLNSILTGLQNPAQPDLLGSFQQGRSEGLQGQILAETFGGKLGKLGTADPKAAAALAEQLGIPKNQKERFDSYVGTIQMATALANGPGGAPAALQLMQEHSDRLKQLDPNADTSRIDEQIEFLRLEPESGIEALNLTTASLIEQNFIADPGGDAGFTLKKDETRFSSSGQEIASGSGSAATIGDLPKILSDSFPNASPEERKQIDATMAAADTVEKGLKEAQKIRTEQRRLKKAKGFQERAVSLLGNIINSDQLGDVTGSIEGGIDFRFSDVEAELIADIDEAQNILTAENMDLMTGVLSESDIKLLKNLSSGGLNRKRGTKRFLKDVTQLREKLSAQLVSTVDDNSSSGSQSGQNTDQQGGQFTSKSGINFTVE